MKTFLIIVGIINMIYYTLTCIGKIYGNDVDNMPLDGVNIFIQISVILFLFLVGLIPIINFFVATRILYKEILKDIL